MLSEQLKEDLKNPWLRGVLAVVAVTVTVNIAFISYAYWSPPALVVKDYYEKGKSYFHDQKIRQQEAVSAWRLQLLAPQHAKLNQMQTYRLYVLDHQGNPVHSGDVTLYAYRPSNADDDFRTTLTYADSGTFTGSLRFPQPGKWDLIAKISSGEHQYDTAQRIFVEK